MFRPLRGTWVEDLQSLMDPTTAEEPFGSRAESRCGWEGQRVFRGFRRAGTKKKSAVALRAGPGRGEQGRRQEDRQQDACLAALRGHRHVQLDTEGIASLFVSLTQYKQITHGPMEPAKHGLQCIQNPVSYKEHILHITDAAYSTKQLSLNARLGVQLGGEHRFSSLSVPQRPAFINWDNCTPELETREPRMCHEDLLLGRSIQIFQSDASQTPLKSQIGFPAKSADCSLLPHIFLHKQCFKAAHVMSNYLTPPNWEFPSEHSRLNV